MPWQYGPIQALTTDTSGMGEKRWQADMKAACASFDIPAVRKLAGHDTLMSSQDAPWMMDTLCALSRSCSKHKGDPAELVLLLDLFLLNCEVMPRNNLNPSMAPPWNDGLLASLLLMLDHPACEQWLRTHQVPIDSSGAHPWADSAMRRMDLVDLNPRL